MAINDELILDIAGVLAINFHPFFWQELSKETDVNQKLLLDG
jgi:hypothetical protein